MGHLELSSETARVLNPGLRAIVTDTTAWDKVLTYARLAGFLGFLS
jgi:hypothetical protein